MRIDPQLRVLRGDDAPQREAQAAVSRSLAAWRDRSGFAALEAELASFDRGGPIEDHPLLAACFDPHEEVARELIDGYVKTACAALEAAPLAQVPTRHFTNGTTSTLVLALHGGTTLALSAVDGTVSNRQKPAQSTAFVANQTWERTMAGTARAELIERGGAGVGGLQIAPISLAPGGIQTRDGTRQALVLREINGTLVTLRLQRRRSAHEVTREVRIADGALLHQSAPTARDSRIEIAASLLGRMGRTDAAPLLAAIAREEGTASVRWQALRECLALDTASGFAALSALAQEPADPLAVPAGALRATLIERYPALAEAVPCPA